MTKKITLPLLDEQILNLKAGDSVLLSGKIIGIVQRMQLPKKKENQR